MGNKFVYPAPNPSYAPNPEDPSLIYVPQKIERSACGFCCSGRKDTTRIPCRYIQCQTRPSSYLVIFFHGNSEDIGDYLTNFLSQMSLRFSINVLCPEYPTYGIYHKRDDSVDMDEAMMNDAKTVLKYCQTKLGYRLENIILIGRSLGTGVVAQLASETTVRGAVLISPYTSIKETARRLVGTVLAIVIPDIFRSIDVVDSIQHPMLYIHGEADTLIPPDMSVQLYDRTRAPKSITLNHEMTHNEFKIESDLFIPIHKFMIEKLGLASHLQPWAKPVETYVVKEQLLSPSSPYVPKEQLLSPSTAYTVSYSTTPTATTGYTTTSGYTTTTGYTTTSGYVSPRPEGGYTRSRQFI